MYIQGGPKNRLFLRVNNFQEGWDRNMNYMLFGKEISWEYADNNNFTYQLSVWLNILWKWSLSVSTRLAKRTGKSVAVDRDLLERQRTFQLLMILSAVKNIVRAHTRVQEKSHAKRAFHDHLCAVCMCGGSGQLRCPFASLFVCK